MSLFIKRLIAILISTSKDIHESFLCVIVSLLSTETGTDYDFFHIIFNAAANFDAFTERLTELYLFEQYTVLVKDIRLICLLAIAVLSAILISKGNA